MKRTTIFLSLIFALAIALSVSIPTLADTSDTGTTEVRGVLGAHIDIEAVTALVNLPELVPGTTVNTSSTGGCIVNVKANKDGWTLAVEEQTNGDGQMSWSTHNLTKLLYIAGGDLSYTSLTNGAELEVIGSGAKGNTVNTRFDFSQETTWDDWAVDDPATEYYTITLLFTARAP